ncbi:GntR family transcriptional regulator [Amycolatopsis echigonensis]|uniref:GntR family transcriptional regulator n=2 Tax=Pseudonocardiaceae TaxID=2070 RepID=A0A2N3WV07_9PSEU|nr:GntR family transcriptional regulator [Amycolatopsis niigatensis]
MHLQIADDLRERINSGALQAGEPLPPVRELQGQWNCASITVRSALTELRQEGLITASGRGKPPVVRPQVQKHPIHLSARWTNEQKALVLRPRDERAKRGAIEMIAGIPIDEIISTHVYKDIPAGAELAAEFSIQDTDVLQQRTYEMKDPKSGHRIAFSVSYIPLDLISSNPELLDDANEPWPGGHQHQLYTVGIELGRIERTVTAAEPSSIDREKWGMDVGTPLLKVRSRSIDVQDRVVELSDAVYPADRTKIEVSEQLTPWPAGYPKYNHEQEHGK